MSRLQFSSSLSVVLLICCASGIVMSFEYPRSVTKITAIPTQVSSLGEGPYFSEDEYALYYVDATAGDFIRLDVVSGLETKIHVGGITSIIIPYSVESGQFIVTSTTQILKLNWRNGQTQLITTVSSETDGTWERFNDGKCDPMGRLYIGTVLEYNSGGVVPNGGSLYRLDGQKLTKIASGFSISNGMSWSNNDEHDDFYFNDSEGRKIYHFKYNITDGSISNQRVLIDVATHPDFVSDEFPDGQAIDQFGFIWVAMWNGRRIVKINPNTAQVVDEVRFSRVQIPSSIAFGRYRGEYGFYVTTASTGIDPINLLDDGKIHHVSIQGGQIKRFDPTVI